MYAWYKNINNAIVVWNSSIVCIFISRLSKNPFTEVPLSDIYFVRSTLEFLDLSETHIKVSVENT